MIAERVKAVVSGQFDVDEDDISNDLSFEELGADQIDVAELIEALCDEFEIEIPTECSENIVTFGDAVSCVKKYMKNGG